MTQLTLKRIGQDDFAVMADNRLAGRIMLKPLPSGAVWFWTVTGPHLPAPLQPSHGETETLNLAKAAYKAKFAKWEALHERKWVGDPPDN